MAMAMAMDTAITTIRHNGGVGDVEPLDVPHRPA